MSELNERLQAVLSNLMAEPLISIRRRGPGAIEMRIAEQKLVLGTEAKGRGAALQALNELQRRMNLEFEKEFKKLSEL